MTSRNLRRRFLRSNLMLYKKGMRILAVEDGPLDKSGRGVLVVGIMGRVGTIEGIISFRIEADGNDATEKLAKAIKKSRFREQIRLIAFNGITLAGLNFLDVPAFYKTFRLPIIAITRKKPHPELLKKAIVKSGIEPEKKIRLLNSILGSVTVKKVGGFYVQGVGLEEGNLKGILENSFEMLRLAHLIARGVETGESKGRL